MGFLTKILIVVLIVAAIAFTVKGAPPVTTVFEGSEGFEIEFPTIDYTQVNKGVSFHFHVFNLSNGQPVINDSVSCFFHLYHNNGSHIYKNQNVEFEPSDLFDWSVPISSGNFSTVGTYSYIFQCNNTHKGGFVSRQIIVTGSGVEELLSDNNTSSTSISIVLFIIIINVLLFIIPLMKKEMLEHEIANIILRRSLMALGFYLAVLNTAIVQTLAVTAGLSINSELSQYMFLLGTAGYIMLASTVLKTMFDVIKSYSLSKEKKRMGEE